MQYEDSCRFAAPGAISTLLNVITFPPNCYNKYIDSSYNFIIDISCKNLSYFYIKVGLIKFNYV